jgi:tetratricopeptide (TPR) repeat protein
MKKYLLLFLLGILVSACSTGLQKNKQKQNEIELSKAAQSSKPPQPVEFDPRNIDPAYLRMQADYHFTLAESFALDGNIERAIEEYKLTLVYDPNSPQVRLKLAGELAKKGQLVQAVDQAEEAVKLEDKFADGHLFLGNLYTMTKLYDRAKEEYQRAYDLDPQNTDAPMYIGAILAEEKKYDESIAYFNKLTNKFKQTHLIYYYIGRIELERKNDKKAEIEFKKAIHAKPDFLDAVVSLGALLESQNKIKEATQTYLAYQQKRGRSSKIAYALGRIYMDQNNYADAYKQFTLIEDTEPDNLNVKVKMALILIEQKKYPKAISKLKEILVQAPDSEKIRFYLAA